LGVVYTQKASPTHQALIIAHRDTDKDHIHIVVVNRVGSRHGLSSCGPPVSRRLRSTRFAMEVLDPLGVIAPEHRAQLLGHQGRPMTDTLYLHRHEPDLARAAAWVEDHLRLLMGDPLHRQRRRSP
jgi:hypothetical protein